MSWMPAPYQKVPNRYRSALMGGGGNRAFSSPYSFGAMGRTPPGGTTTFGDGVPTSPNQTPWRPSTPVASPWGNYGGWGDGDRPPFQDFPYYEHGQVNRDPLWMPSVYNPDPPWWNPSQVTGGVEGGPAAGQQISPLQNPLYNQGYGSLYNWSSLIPSTSAFYRPGLTTPHLGNVPSGLEHWFPEEGYDNPFTGLEDPSPEDIYGTDEVEYLGDDTPPLPEGRRWTLTQMESLLTDLARNQYNRNLFRPSLGWSEYFPGAERVQEAGIFHERPTGWSPVPGFEENIYAPHFGKVEGPIDITTGLPALHSGWITPGVLGETLFGTDPVTNISAGVSDPRLQYWQSQWMPHMDLGPAGRSDPSMNYLEELIAGDYAVPNLVSGISYESSLIEDGLPRADGQDFSFDGSYIDDWRFNDSFNEEVTLPDGSQETRRETFERLMVIPVDDMTPGQKRFMDSWIDKLSDDSMPKKWRKKWEKYSPTARFDWTGTGEDWQDHTEFTSSGPDGPDPPRERLENVLMKIAEGQEPPNDHDIDLLNYWIPRLANAQKQQVEYWGKPYEWKRYGTERAGVDDYYGGTGYAGYRSNVNAWGAPLRWQPGPSGSQPLGEFRQLEIPESWMNLGYGISPFEHGTTGYGSKMWGANRVLPGSKASMESGISGAYPHYQSVPYLSQAGRYQNPAYVGSYTNRLYPYRQGYADGGMIGSEVINFAERHSDRNGDSSSEIYDLINKLRDAILNPSKESDAVIRAFKNAFGEEQYEEFMQALLASEGISGGDMMSPGMPMGSGAAPPGGDMLSSLMSMVQGGPAGQYQHGGMISGPGNGLSDSVMGSIEGREPVRLSDGEYVVPAGIVSALGNGSSDAGGKVLDGMVGRVGSMGQSHKVPGDPIDLGRVLPA